MEYVPIKPYRGPPPRRDLVQSPSKMKEWKGNDIFNMDVNGDVLPRKNETVVYDEQAPIKSPREEYSEYSKLAMEGGHKGLLYGNSTDTDNLETSRKSKRCENISEYNKIALQGGHRGLINLSENIDDSVERRQKGCDNISDYNKLAKQGGHKGLLSLDCDEQASPVRKSKGEGALSEYSRLAKQGGHKDLLVIEENKPSPVKQPTPKTSGDWFSHDTNNNSNNKSNAAGRVTTPSQNGNRPSSASSRGSNRSMTEALPGGREQSYRAGKKPSDQKSGVRAAPFATNY